MDAFAAVTVNRRLIKNQQPAINQLPVTPTAAGRDRTLRAENPVGAVGPGAVQESSQREQVRDFLRLPIVNLLPASMKTPLTGHYLPPRFYYIIGSQSSKN